MQPWQILSSRPLLVREPWLSVWEERVKLPNGLIISDYLRTRARDYAMVVAVLADGTIPLVRQYKHGVGRALYDLPAGYLDGPETPLHGAQRELCEETGLVAANWRLLGHPVIDSNRGNDRAHLFLALDARQESEPELDLTEAIEVTYHTPAELRAMVLQREIESLASVAGIMLALDILQNGDGAGSP